MKPARLPPVDVQLLGGLPHDKDAEDVRKYAEQHPDEDKELDKGGVSEQQLQEETPEQEVASEAFQGEMNLRSPSSMAPHPLGSL